MTRRDSREIGRLEDSRGGAAILEFALVLPIVVVLLGGAFELGRALLIREEMIAAVRGGASYLARVPDPSCDMACGDGPQHALAMARDQIVAGSGLPSTSVAVASRFDAAADTVTVTAALQLDVDLLRLAGLGPTLSLNVAQTERRLAR